MPPALTVPHTAVYVGVLLPFFVMWSSYLVVTLWVKLLICLSLCPSICPVLASHLKSKRHKKTKINASRSLGTSNVWASFQLERTAAQNVTTGPALFYS